MDFHKRHLSACDVESDQVQYRSFSRNTLERASTGTLKQPRLPGSEKFRFSKVINVQPPQDLLRPHSAISTNQQRRSYRPSSIASDGSSDAGEMVPSSSSSHVRARSKRRPVIPISKNTSQMLNNTNADLSADTMEFIRNETSHLTTICKRYIDETCHVGRSEEPTSDGWSCSSSEQSLERTSPSPAATPSKHGTMSMMSSSSTASSPAMRYGNPSTRMGNGLPEVNNNDGGELKPEGFATIRSSRLRARTFDKFSSTSPTCSTSSAEDDIWVMRTDVNQ